MFRFDPLRWIYRVYSLLNRCGRWLMSPFSLVQNFFFYLPRLFRRHIRLGNIGDWGLVRATRHKFYWLASRPKKLANSTMARRAGKTSPIRLLRRIIGLLFQASFVEPIKWLVQIAGVVTTWGRSRSWLAILFLSMPGYLMLGALYLDWRGGRISKASLSARYVQWGEAELGNIEQAFQSSGRLMSRFSETGQSEPSYSRDHRTGFSRVQMSSDGVSTYGDLLFRRVHVLSPSDQSSFVIGLKLLEKGAVSQAQSVFNKIAPDDQVRDYRAHAVMATILLERIAATADESLFPAFQHHVAAGARWGYIPAEVLAASAEIHWYNGRRNQAFELLNVAAENRSEFFLLYYERALEAEMKPLAEAIRDRAITRLSRQLRQNPRDNSIRSNLAAFEFTLEDGVKRAEELLQEGERINPSPMLSRALSEVYLKQFKLLSEENLANSEAIELVDKAMQADPSNPNLADLIGSLMQNEIKAKSQSQLVSALNDELVAGKATTGSHALLAEYYLQNNQKREAIVHLEQVYRIAPAAARFSNSLAHEYAAADRLDEAFYVANRALTIISKKGLLSERYVDELLDTLGKIYHQQQNWAEAIPVYELCIKLNPERSATRLRLARIYRKVGKEDAADKQEYLASESAQMADRRKTLVQKLATPGMILHQNTEEQAGGDGQTEPEMEQRPVGQKNVNVTIDDAHSDLNSSESSL